jgi:hypothetical protein
MDLLFFFEDSNHQSVISLNSLKRNEKKSTSKLNEFNQLFQFHQLQSPTAVSISHPSIHTPLPSHTSIPVHSFNSSSLNSSITHNFLTDEITNTITRTIIDWLNKKKHELNLVNTTSSFQQGTDFQAELNKSRDGIIMDCKYGMRNSIGQKQEVLVVRD